jgi:hypothetical protein
MARYKKGECGNRLGRPRGSKNQLRIELRDTIKEIIAAEMKNIPELLSKVAPEKRVKIFIELLEFVLSKPRSDEPELEHTATPKEGFYELMMKRYNSLKQSGSSIKPIKVEIVDFDNEDEFPRH